jgi:TonB family protein
VSSSSIDGRIDAALAKRLGAALTASAALHALVALGLQAPAAGLHGTGERLASEAAPLRARLREAVAPEAPSAARDTQMPSRTTATRSGLGGPSPLPAPRYYSARELDVRPGIMIDVQPEYPAEAAGTAGRVVVRLFIGEEGQVERVAIQEAEPRGLFERAVERAFAAARFSPGMKDGRAVKAMLALEVNFEKGPQ